MDVGYSGQMSSESLKSEHIIDAAVLFIEKEGVAALTMRALGRELGVDPSVVYRHFVDKSDLLAALGSALLNEIDLAFAMSASTPRERLKLAVSEVRRVMQAKPVTGLILANSGNNPPGTQVEIVHWSVQQLREIGLTGVNLVVGYQVLEGFVLGMTSYDISSQPNPLEVRRQWFRQAEIAEFDDISHSTDEIAAINEKTFQFGLNAILDKIELLAQQ
jgi:AcrR family transcriptional regulator